MRIHEIKQIIDGRIPPVCPMTFYGNRCHVCKKPFSSTRSTDWCCSDMCMAKYAQSKREKEFSKPFVYLCPKCQSPKGYLMESYFKKATEKQSLCDGCKREEWIETTRKKITVNSVGCQIMDGLNELGYKFLHGKNGGEYFVNYCGGYFLDGFDRENGVIFEYDEPHHKQSKNEDVKRQNYILQYFRLFEFLPVNFFRYDESTDKLYEIFEDTSKEWW